MGYDYVVMGVGGVGERLGIKGLKELGFGMGNNFRRGRGERWWVIFEIWNVWMGDGFFLGKWLEGILGRGLFGGMGRGG